MYSRPPQVAHINFSLSGIFAHPNCHFDWTTIATPGDVVFYIYEDYISANSAETGETVYVGT